MPDIRYVKSGDVSIAYTVTGEGPFDLILVPGFISHIEVAWEDKGLRRFLERLASFSRLIFFDKRGTGLSDRGVAFNVDDYALDVNAVMQAAGSEHAAIFGISEGASAALLYAATYPDRVTALVVYGGYARMARAADYPMGITVEELQQTADYVSDRWGTGVSLGAWAPSLAGDDNYRQQWARFQRLAASPRDVRSIITGYQDVDVRPALPAISAPTLVLHRKGDKMVPAEMGRYIAEHVAGARYVELEGRDHFFWTEGSDALLDEVQEFLTGARHVPEPTRKLATVLFTDIVGSTELASSLGDSSWRDFLERHDAMVRRSLDRFQGREVKTTGDGFLAVFDSPTAAIRAGEAIRGGATGIGCEVKVGIHTGEIELIGQDVGGIGVHIARRVADLAGPGQVLVSPTVPGVVVGSGIEFATQGMHTLKGVPGEWALSLVTS